MQGEPWIDRVMAPLMFVGLSTSDYNRIWEAVARGDERQGGALVQAIINCAPKVAAKALPLQEKVRP